ncbi:hypothetical protein OsJ_22668 [Oryza sativa Japonica Group]|uniref:Uncharacterized protein n=1 Tax=Oryza sativa subsp. japonica TaxID=39947 RepID=A3BFF1_ORYSJ|nr:hypothetical protein OsJ_22668 [Oryza sativa Japonica Group]
MGALLHFLSLLLFLSLLQGAQAATFTISNRCGYTVWPGILSNAGVAPPSTTGFALSPGQTLAVSVGRRLGACPRAYSYAYDDATSTFTWAAAGGGYDVVFCPGMSRNSNDKSQPENDQIFNQALINFFSRLHNLDDIDA